MTADYQDKTLAKSILGRIRERMSGETRRIALMEVCGTHTMAIGKAGLRRVMPPNLRLLSGPGCPVCVTPGGYIDAAADLALRGVTVVTFGDMVRVPGTRTSIESARAEGGKVVVASSITAALDIARRETGDVVFLAVGFETTAPTIAASVLAAEREGLKNFSVLVSHKLVPPALRVILNDPECAVTGFILPGHVSTIIGVEPYRFLVDEFRVPGVIAGFELIDVLAGIDALVELIQGNEPAVLNKYPRVVRPEGNPVACAATDKVFETTGTAWRGVGFIPGSGLGLREEFAAFDAARRYGIDLSDYQLPDGCECGRVMKGLIRPTQCPLYGNACTPQEPVGACMVSVEGACSVSYKYGEA